MANFAVMARAVAIGFVFTLFAAGCTGGKGDAEPDANGSAPAAEEVEFMPGEVEFGLIGSLPASVPLYEGKVQSSSAEYAEASGQPAWSVVITTPDPLENVDKQIRADFSQNGWEIVSEMEFGGGYQLVARGGGPTTSITYNDISGSEITITYGIGG